MAKKILSVKKMNQRDRDEAIQGMTLSTLESSIHKFAEGVRTVTQKLFSGEVQAYEWAFMFRYAGEGKLGYFYDKDLQPRTEQNGSFSDEDFWDAAFGIDVMSHLAELESGDSFPVEATVTVDMYCARAKCDYYRITQDPNIVFTAYELALLARVRPITVRNQFNKQIPAHKFPDTKRMVAPAKDAYAWLETRKGYKQTDFNVATGLEDSFKEQILRIYYLTSEWTLKGE